MDHRDNTPRGGRDLLDRIDAWIITAFEALARALRSENATSDRGGDGGSEQVAGNDHREEAYPSRRSIGGFVASGLRKVDMVRRSASMQKRHASIVATIRETRRVIRRTPRAHRRMFDGYRTFLDDVERRERLLYRHLSVAEGHLQRHDPVALGEEIRSLERYVRTVDADAPARATAEQSLAARRELLNTVEEFESRYSAIAAQLSHIAATLDLNLVRISAIASRSRDGALSAGADEYFGTRMHEMTEQLELLEESIRELDKW